MTTMNTEVYDALRAVNVPEEKARAAAEGVGAEADRSMAHLDRQFTMVEWMLALNLAISLAILLKLCAH